MPFFLRAAPFLLIAFPNLAFAHGNGLVLMAIGIPFALIAYLASALVFVWAAPKDDRMKRVSISFLALPVWLLCFLSPWFSSFEVLISPYETQWSIGLPLLLLAAVTYFSIEHRRKRVSQES